MVCGKQGEKPVSISAIRRYMRMVQAQPYRIEVSASRFRDQAPTCSSSTV